MGLSSLVSSYVNAAGDTFSDIDLAPLAMGGLTKGVSVKAMAQAYASFANEGVWREARTYTKVVDADGKVVLDNTQQSHVAMKDMTAWYITYMLENTVESGSGTAAQIENMTVAGKTGTTTSDFDRWFAGYTPYYTGVVWCGYDDPEEVVLTDSSANPATVLWQKVMAKGVHEGLANKEFNKPTNVVECTVCQDSGLLMTDACREDPRGSRAITVELSLLRCADAELQCPQGGGDLRRVGSRGERILQAGGGQYHKDRGTAGRFACLPGTRHHRCRTRRMPCRTIRCRQAIIRR